MVFERKGWSMAERGVAGRGGKVVEGRESGQGKMGRDGVGRGGTRRDGARGCLGHNTFDKAVK